MTSADIPERLEWRCMLPVRVFSVTEQGIKCVVSYNSTGLDIVKTIVPDGIKRSARSELPEWFYDTTEDHHVELVGGLHGSGRFYGHDRKTGEVRSLYHDMRALGYAVEDDE